VLEEALAWADGVLVGAATLRAHGTTCLIRQPQLLAQRQAEGRPPQPTAVVVSRHGQLDPALPFFSQPLQRWLLAPAEVVAAADHGFADRLPLVCWPQALTQLAQAGLRRLVLLGGAQLASQLLAAELVQELQLTLVPQLLGGAQLWWPATAPWPPAGAHGWELLEHRPLGDSELLLRYRRSS